MAWGVGGGGQGGAQPPVPETLGAGAERIGEGLWGLAPTGASCVFPRPLGVRSECCHLQIIQMQDHVLTSPHPTCSDTDICPLERTLDAQRLRRARKEISNQVEGFSPGMFIPSWFHLG